jgi:hypothetical protein
VIEAAREVVGEELLGGVELTAGSVGEQSEKATASKVLTEEDDSGGILLPSFASRRCRQALGAGGAR